MADRELFVAAMLYRWAVRETFQGYVGHNLAHDPLNLARWAVRELFRAGTCLRWRVRASNLHLGTFRSMSMLLDVNAACILKAASTLNWAVTCLRWRGQALRSSTGQQI